MLGTLSPPSPLTILSFFSRPTPKIPREFLDNVRVFQGLACVKNPSTRHANQWPYPPDSDTLAPREQVKFLPDEDEDPITTVKTDEIEPSQLNVDRLTLNPSSESTPSV